MTPFWDGELSLASETDLGSFTCGRDSVDRWLHDRARQSLHHVATTLLMVQGTVVAFFAVKTIVVTSDGLPKRYEKYASEEGYLPAVLLAQMGVNTTHQGNGAGRAVFREALARAVVMYEESRIPLFLVDAADESLVRFYEKLNMVRTSPSSLRLVASLGTISKALRGKDLG